MIPRNRSHVGLRPKPRLGRSRGPIAPLRSLAGRAVRGLAVLAGSVTASRTFARASTASLTLAFVALVAIAAGAGVWYGWLRTPAAQVEPAAVYWTCVMHPESHEAGPGTCPKCGMDLVRSDTIAPPDPSGDPAGTTAAGAAAPTATGAAEPGSQRAPVAIDARRQQLIGLRTARAERERLARTIRAVGLVRYDETRLADVNLKLEGWIRDLFVDATGQFVRRGDPLFTLYSPDLLTTQNEYLLALTSRDQLRQSQIADVREQADRLVETARRRLDLWDLPADQLALLDETRKPQTTMTFRSAVTGHVIEKRALKGMRVTAGESLYRIADLSVVWVEADFYEREIALVRTGQRAVVTLDAYPGEQFFARVVYVYPYVEEATRTVRVRFEMANPRGRLKPGMYANVELSIPIGEGVVVPTNALIDSGRRQIVFVSLGDGYFEPRDVTVGQRFERTVQILRGLDAGEEVATAANFFIDADSQLQAALQGFEPLPAPAAPGGPTLQIAVKTVPDPPKAGENQAMVTVTDADGQPVEGADVTVGLFMAAMPSMNMPAMKSDAKLPHAGGGVYRGVCNILMLGRWDVTITVSKDGKRLGTRQLSLVAR